MRARARDRAAGVGVVLIETDDTGRRLLRHRIYLCRFIDMLDAAGLLRLLGDGTRLRLLRVLAREPMNVTELTAVLGLAQSGVSRHLGLLRDAGVVAEERSGTHSWYRLAPGVESADDQRAG